MNIKNILVPLDESEKTFESLNKIKLLFNPLEVCVHLFHVVDNYDIITTDFSDPEIPKKLSKEILDTAEFLLKGYNTTKTSILGSHASVVSNILTAINQKNIDIVVMTKTGHGFFDQYIIGSVTSSIIKRSPVPVIAIP